MKKERPLRNCTMSMRRIMMILTLMMKQIGHGTNLMIMTSILLSLQHIRKLLMILKYCCLMFILYFMINYSG